MDLADRRGGERLALELREVLLERAAELLAQQLRHPLERQRRHLVAQAASVRLNSSRSDSGIAVNSTVERTCPIFIAAPRIWPELLDQLARQRGGALPGRRVGALGRADEVGGAGARPAQALARDEAADAPGPGQAGAGGGLGVLGHVRELRSGEAADHTRGVEVHFFETPAEWRAWLEAQPRDGDRGRGRLPAQGDRPADDDVVGGRRRGAVLRLDRRRPALDRRDELPQPLHAAQADEHLEQGQHRQGRGAGGGGEDDPGGPRRVRAPHGGRLGDLLVRGRAAGGAARALRRRAAADAAASADFAPRPPWYRRAAVHWVTSAKREATRERRLAELVECSAAGRECRRSGAA